MKKLLDPRYIGGLALFFLLIGFIDVLFVSDANSIANMTIWGKTSVITFIILLGWMAIFMFIIPLFHKLLKK